MTSIVNFKSFALAGVTSNTVNKNNELRKAFNAFQSGNTDKANISKDEMGIQTLLNFGQLFQKGASAAAKQQAIFNISVLKSLSQASDVTGNKNGVINFTEFSNFAVQNRFSAKA